MATIKSYTAKSSIELGGDPAQIKAPMVGGNFHAPIKDLQPRRYPKEAALRSARIDRVNKRAVILSAGEFAQSAFDTSLIIADQNATLEANEAFFDYAGKERQVIQDFLTLEGKEAVQTYPMFQETIDGIQMSNVNSVDGAARAKLVGLTERSKHVALNKASGHTAMQRKVWAENQQLVRIDTYKKNIFDNNTSIPKMMSYINAAVTDLFPNDTPDHEILRRKTQQEFIIYGYQTIIDRDPEDYDGSLGAYIELKNMESTEGDELTKATQKQLERTGGIDEAVLDVAALENPVTSKLITPSTSMALDSLMLRSMRRYSELMELKERIATRAYVKESRQVSAYLESKLDGVTEPMERRRIFESIDWSQLIAFDPRWINNKRIELGAVENAYATTTTALSEMRELRKLAELGDEYSLTRGAELLRDRQISWASYKELQALKKYADDAANVAKPKNKELIKAHKDKVLDEVSRMVAGYDRRQGIYSEGMLGSDPAGQERYDRVLATAEVEATLVYETEMVKSGNPYAAAEAVRKIYNDPSFVRELLNPILPGVEGHANIGTVDQIADNVRQATHFIETSYRRGTPKYYNAMNMVLPYAKYLSRYNEKFSGDYGTATYDIDYGVSQHIPTNNDHRGLANTPSVPNLGKVRYAYVNVPGAGTKIIEVDPVTAFNLLKTNPNIVSIVTDDGVHTPQAVIDSANKTYSNNRNYAMEIPPNLKSEEPIDLNKWAEEKVDKAVESFGETESGKAATKVAEQEVGTSIAFTGMIAKGYNALIAWAKSVKNTELSRAMKDMTAERYMEIKTDPAKATPEELENLKIIDKHM